MKRHENSINSLVKGEMIIIDLDILNACLNITDFSAHLYCSHSLLITHRYAVYRLCVNINLLKSNKLTHGALGQKWAQLHRLITHVIFLKGLTL